MEPKFCRTNRNESEGTYEYIQLVTKQDDQLKEFSNVSQDVTSKNENPKNMNISKLPTSVLLKLTVLFTFKFVRECSGRLRTGFLNKEYKLVSATVFENLLLIQTCSWNCSAWSSQLAVKWSHEWVSDVKASIL